MRARTSGNSKLEGAFEDRPVLLVNAKQRRTKTLSVSNTGEGFPSERRGLAVSGLLFQDQTLSQIVHSRECGWMF